MASASFTLSSAFGFAGKMRLEGDKRWPYFEGGVRLIQPCIPEAQLLNYIDNISAKADIFTSTGHMEKAFALGTNVIK